LNKRLLKIILLFISVTIVVQIYYVATARFNLWFQYFPWGYTLQIIIYASIFALAILFVGKFDLPYLGIQFRKSWIRYALLGFVFALFHSGARMLFIEGHYYRSYPIEPELYIPAFIILGLVIGLSEESVFRGYILKNLLKFIEKTHITERYKPIISILLSSILFGVYHIYFIGSGNLVWWLLYVLQAFTAGIFISLLYLDTECNLISPIIYHSFIIILVNIIPWTPISGAYYRLIITTLLNIVQIVLIKGMRLLETRT